MEQINKIAFGILCFGEKKYFDGTIKKLNSLMELGFKCYILTDDFSFFEKRYSPYLLKVIEYKKELKSYHDKIILVKEILKNFDVAIIIDADINFNMNTKLLKQLKNYNFKEGISYIENLSRHRINKIHVKDLDLMLKNDWKFYFAYINSKTDDFIDKELIWEHFLVFKNYDYSQFYKEYEKLQIIKEYCDVLEDKNILGAGEGITISMSSEFTNTPIQKDEELYDIIKHLIVYE